MNMNMSIKTMLEGRTWRQEIRAYNALEVMLLGFDIASEAEVGQTSKIA